MTGKNSALVVMKKAGDKPAGLVMNWPFNAKKGEAFEVKLEAMANNAASFFLRLEKAGTGTEKFIDQEIAVSGSAKKFGFTSDKIPEDGPYRISIYLGNLKPGTKVWIDNVELIPGK
jgi:arylsulfatase